MFVSANRTEIKEESHYIKLTADLEHVKAGKIYCGPICGCIPGVISVKIQFCLIFELTLHRVSPHIK